MADEGGRDQLSAVEAGRKRAERRRPMHGYPPAVQAPAVVTCYRVYCRGSAVFYLVVAILGIVFLVIDPSLLGEKADMDPMEIKIQAIVFLVLGLPFFLVYLTALF